MRLENLFLYKEEEKEDELKSSEHSQIKLGQPTYLKQVKFDVLEQIEYDILFFWYTLNWIPMLYDTQTNDLQP